MSDLDRLRAEYARRKQESAAPNLYSPLNLAYLFEVQGRQRQIVSLLKKHGVTTLHDKTILEVGCGNGSILTEFLQMGTAASNLYGIDLLPDRLQSGRTHRRLQSLACADGQNLPYANLQFDLVIQFTALSSILDKTIQTHIAQEMVRVLRPGGAILWYDMWINPINKQIASIPKRHIKALFPACQISFRRVTLAPPITRRLIPYSWGLPTILERLKFLNTHFLCLITK